MSFCCCKKSKSKKYILYCLSSVQSDADRYFEKYMRSKDDVFHGRIVYKKNCTDMFRLLFREKFYEDDPFGYSGLLSGKLYP